MLKTVEAEMHKNQKQTPTVASEIGKGTSSYRGKIMVLNGGYNLL